MALDAQLAWKAEATFLLQPAALSFKLNTVALLQIPLYFGCYLHERRFWVTWVRPGIPLHPRGPLEDLGLVDGEETSDCNNMGREGELT